MTQHIIVAIVVAAAVVAAARALYRALTNRKSALNPCTSCKVRQQCDRAPLRDDKKTSKKCGCSFGGVGNNDYLCRRN